MWELIARFFGQQPASKHLAKERLRLVLIHDRASVAPQVLEALKGEIIGVITKYLDIDEQCTEVSLSRAEGSVALVANIPVKGLKRQAQA
ncbi:MAG TPA: cell division topological specificity factor MinE [Clostridiales bacterium UBA8153]|nr:cell division topological specificity factor MinE [Clostridiales bacterium UBA8153]